MGFNNLSILLQIMINYDQFWLKLKTNKNGKINKIDYNFAYLKF